MAQPEEEEEKNPWICLGKQKVFVDTGTQVDLDIVTALQVNETAIWFYCKLLLVLLK